MLKGYSKKIKVGKEPEKDKVILLNYSIKATIPVGPFANIIPEINVYAPSLEDAEKYVIPHIDKLFVKYFNAYLNGVPEVKSMQKPTESTHLPYQSRVANATVELQKEQSKMKTEACIKAEQAINGCMSLEAINLVREKIDKSIKLTPEEKVTLSYLVTEKESSLIVVDKNEENKTDTK